MTKGSRAHRVGAASVLATLMVLCQSTGVAQTLVEVPRFAGIPAVQEQSQWCWAASIQAVLAYYGIERQQADIVRSVYGTVVNLPSMGAHGIHQALQRMDFLDGTSIEVVRGAAQLPASLTASTLYSELSAGHPFIVGYVTGPGSGHAVVIYGATFDHHGNPVAVRYYDPWPGVGYREVPAQPFGSTIAAWFPVRAARVLTSGALGEETDAEGQDRSPQGRGKAGAVSALDREPGSGTTIRATEYLQHLIESYGDGSGLADSEDERVVLDAARTLRGTLEDGLVGRISIRRVEREITMAFSGPSDYMTYTYARPSEIFLRFILPEDPESWKNTRSSVAGDRITEWGTVAGARVTIYEILEPSRRIRCKVDDYVDVAVIVSLNDGTPSIWAFHTDPIEVRARYSYTDRDCVSVTAGSPEPLQLLLEVPARH